MAYPDTNLKNDQIDAPFGGVPPNRFGQKARSFIDAVLQFLSAAYLTYLRVPWSTQVVLSGTGNVIGEVCLFAEGQYVAASGYYAEHWTGGGGQPANTIIWGVFAESASAGNRARVIVGGLVPTTVSGLGVLAAGKAISWDTTTGKLRAANNGDVILGYADIQGNVLLLMPGRPV